MIKNLLEDLLNTKLSQTNIDVMVSRQFPPLLVINRIKQEVPSYFFNGIGSHLRLFLIREPRDSSE